MVEQWNCHYLFLRLRSVSAGIRKPNFPLAVLTLLHTVPPSRLYVWCGVETIGPKINFNYSFIRHTLCQALDISIKNKGICYPQVGRLLCHGPFKKGDQRSNSYSIRCVQPNHHYICFRGLKHVLDFVVYMVHKMLCCLQTRNKLKI